MVRFLVFAILIEFALVVTPLMDSRAAMRPSALADNASAADLHTDTKPTPTRKTTAKYPSTGSNAIARRSGGDDFASATPIPTLPFADSGTTAGYNDDYYELCHDADSSGSPDVVYSFEPQNSMAIEIALCNSEYDTKLYLYEDTVSQLIGCNDDNCGEELRKSFLCTAISPGHTYYIVVDGWGGESGTYRMTVDSLEECIRCPELVCPPSAMSENEPCGSDFNGGCNMVSPAFVDILCGDTVCGTAWADTNRRDTDWYRLVLNTETTISWCAVAGFPLHLVILDISSGCSSYVTDTAAIAEPCDTLCLTTTLGPGIYALFAATSRYHEYPCSAGPWEYTAWLSSPECPPPSHVAVQSRTVETNSAGVSSEIFFGNDVDISEFTLPLVARSISGGAFWDNVPASIDTNTWHDRLTGALTSMRSLDKSLADGVSPDQILLHASRTTDPCLAAGPVAGMITLRFDVNGNPGSFEIDTAFFPPSSSTSFVDCASLMAFEPSFSPGTITITPPVDFSLERIALTINDSYVFSVATADFNADENLDVAMIATCCFTPELKVFYGDGNGGFPNSFSSYELANVLTTAFVDADALPDLISVEFSQGDIRTYLNNGDESFAAPRTTAGHSSATLSIAAGYVNEDTDVDLVVGSELYYGDGSGYFSFQGSRFSGFNVNSIGLADINDDGLTDAVISGSRAAIFLGDGAGGFALSDSISIGSGWSVQLTADGNIVDFDEDGHADFALSFPGGGGSNADIHVFLTDGNGHIAKHNVYTVQGVCYPIRVIDQDYDGHLDIAVGSSNKMSIYILRGDGTGSFSHTVTYSTSPVGTIAMAVGDFREDGRWDYVLGSFDTTSSAFLSSEPPVSILDSQMVTTGYNDVQLRVTNPAGLKSEQLGIHVPGARIAARDADSNDVLDQQVSDLNLMKGTYKIQIWRDPSAPPNIGYTLGIGINGHQARTLARNASLPPVGDTFSFEFPIGDGLEVDPPTGGATSSLTPTFDWSLLASANKSVERYAFELDDFWDFADPEIVDTNVLQPQFVPTNDLLPDTLYYWHYRAFEGGSWGPYSATYAVNIVWCDCDCHGDPVECPGVVDVFDVVACVDEAFRNGAPVIDPNPGCPYTDNNVNCDNVVDVFDVVAIVDVAFRNADPAVAFCDPCP